MVTGPSGGRKKRRHKEKREGEWGEEEDDEEKKYDFEDQQIDFVCMDTKGGYDNRNKNKKRHPSKIYKEADKDDGEQGNVEREENELEIRPATKHEQMLEGQSNLLLSAFQRKDYVNLAVHRA